MAEPTVLTILLLQLVCISLVFGIEIDNGVDGEPTISCLEDKVSFWVKTRRPFDGKVYVKGEFAVPECTNSFGGSSVPSGIIDVSPSVQYPPEEKCPPCPTCSPFAPTPNPNQIYRPRREEHPNMPNAGHLTVKLGSCNVKRERQLSPRGVMVQFTVIVSFHQHFITKVDKAYQVRCMYMEADKTVTTQFEVSMPQTTEITGAAPMPVCEYSIRRDSFTGPLIRYTRVGDKVFHVWACKSATDSDMFGMLIHSCTVQDGHGETVPVLTDKGCSVDKFVISQLTYTNTSFAYVESHVFKFADRSALDFSCAITICTKADSSCKSITPPKCDNKTRSKRGRLERNETENSALIQQHWDNQYDLHAQRLTVVDIDADLKSDQLAQLELEHFGQQKPVKRVATTSYDQVALEDDPNYLSNGICLSVVGFGVLVSFCTFVFTVASVVLASLYLLRGRSFL